MTEQQVGTPGPGGAGASGPGTEVTDGPEGPSLSPSRAADFMACPLLYRFRVVDRLPQRPTPEATRGTVVHAVLEDLFDLPAPQRTPERARALVRPAWERLVEAEPALDELFADDDGPARATWLAEARDLVARYFDLEDPTRLEPAEREALVETVLPSGLRLRGYVDRLDVAPATGDLRVVDYKSGRAPAPGLEQRAMFQMRFYALVLWRLRGRVPRVLQLVYLGSGEVLRYEPDEEDLLATERKVTALWRAIERAAREQDWRPSPGALCGWCDHRALCPAFGGTPPPLPDPCAAAAALQSPAAAVRAADELPSPRTSPVDS